MESIKKNTTGFICLSFLFLLFLTSGCEKNQAPIIQNIIPSSTSLKAGESINLSVSTSDPDGDALIFLWEATDGQITTANDLNSISWTAPLNAGLYFCKVSVNDGSVIVSDSVPLTVSKDLIVSPTQLDFGLEETNKTITVTTDGNGIIEFSISASDSWITVDPSSGEASEQASDIIVRVDRTGMNTGSYTGHITLTSESGDKLVGISMEVNNDPILFVNTTSLEFGLSINNRSFFIQNHGGGTLSWSITEKLNWLTLNPMSGSTEAETDEVQLVADRTVLKPGNHEGDITITSNGGNSNIKLSIEISSEGEWLIYDDDKFDGYYETDSKHQFFLTQFDKPTDWKNYRISKIAISFNPSISRDDIELFCFSTQNILGKYYPYQSLLNSPRLNPGGGWNEWEVDWSINIEKFCVGYRQIEDKTPMVHYDKTVDNQRSYYVDTDSKGFPVREINWAIRVFVEKTDSDPEPGKWLGVDVKPGDYKKLDYSRLNDYKD